MTGQTERTRRWRRLGVFLLLLILGLVAVFITHDVSTALTKSDQDYAERILREAGHDGLVGSVHPAAFDEQVDTILAVQDAVLSIAPEGKGIPFDQPRELSDLYKARAGLCFDRSRAMEKILTSSSRRGRPAARRRP